MRRIPLYLSAALVSCAACASTSNKASDADPGGDAQASAGDEGYELQVARFELEIAELEAQSKTGAAARAIAEAERELAEARMALAAYVEIERPNEINKSATSLLSMRYRRDHQVDEYKELEAMYSQEELAEMTKELVLKRGAHDLELAERQLAAAEIDHKLVTETKLTEKQRELEAEVEKAEAALEKARREAAKAQKEKELELLRARRALEEAQEKAEKKAGDQ